MLDITSNQGLSYGTGFAGTANGMGTGLLDDEMMDPLFDEDWLHEHNLDILFDLFEEEIESKGADSNNSSSTIFGTSPVTSYLFGTSPSLASALDLYHDLLFFDNQPNNNNNNASSQQQQTQDHQATSSSTANLSDLAATSNSTTDTPNSLVNTIQKNGKHSCTLLNANSTSGANLKGSKANRLSGAQQVSHQHKPRQQQSLSTLTNAMRIKRGLKKGQSEGTSLLARPLSCNNASKTGGTTSGTAKMTAGVSTSEKIRGSSSVINKTMDSDKNSAKLTKSKNSIIGNDNTSIHGVDINYSRQSLHRHQIHNYHRHVRHITGCAVLKEHAYAIRTQ